MAKNIKEIVTGANEVIGKINEQIGVIDNCQATMDSLEQSDISLLLEDGRLADLNALDMEQKAALKSGIRDMLTHNIDRAARFLRSVQGGTQEDSAGNVRGNEKSVPKPEENVSETAKSVSKEPELAAEQPKPPVRKSKMTVEVVTEMIKDGYSREDIAKRYGYKTTQTVDNFIMKNKIKQSVLEQGNDKAVQLTEENIPEIMALYTNGPFNLRDTAAELKTTKKILHEFVQKHHLEKPERR